jgi:monofunctional glycosyltransferase
MRVTGRSANPSDERDRRGLAAFDDDPDETAGAHREVMIMSTRARRILLVIASLVGIIVLYLAVAAAWAYAVTPSIVMRASTPRLLDLGSLPDRTVGILVRVEDPSFQEHPGIDPFEPGQGLVSITRALVNMLYLERYDLAGVAGALQGMYRFVDRIAGPIDLGPDAMALVVDSRLGKRRQLQLFLQHVYMGRHGNRQIYGFPDAARAYFAKDARQLSRQEIITLVAMIIGPNQFHPVRHPDALAERVRRIDRLLRNGCRPRGVRDVYYPDCATRRR